MVAESTDAANTQAATTTRKARTMKVGRVVSDKMDKTIVVAVDFTVQHRIYKKALRRTHKFKAHDEVNQCRIGDRVRIEETRPISKEKHWIVREVLVAATAEQDAARLEAARATVEQAQAEGDTEEAGA
jgi:small subunit ribosomal protein S17